ARIIETVGPAANLISLVAPDNCGQSLCTNTRVSGHNHPDWLRALRANSAYYFHVIAIITGWSVFLESKKVASYAKKIFLLLSYPQEIAWQGVARSLKGRGGWRDSGL